MPNERLADKLPILRESPTGIPAIDQRGYSRWPNLFCELATRYTPPSDLLLVLLFLWRETMGNSPDFVHTMAISQTMVRERNARRWLAALVECGFFTRSDNARGSVEGDIYEYVIETSAAKWETFFETAGGIANFPNWDAVSPERFARIFGRAIGKEYPLLYQGEL